MQFSTFDLRVLFINVKIKIWKTTILPSILYQCETSLTSTDEHGLSMFEDRTLRIIFEPNRDEVTSGW
jgi:hypothetical protein